MKEYVAKFADHIAEAGSVVDATSIEKIKSFRNVVVCGLGGSGIGASIVGDLIQQEIKVPYNVVKGYFLPHWVDKNTLIIINSYSGNTEETVHVMQQAIEKNASVICISSGGKVEEMATKNNYPLLRVPKGLPPRASLGYSLVYIFYALQSQKLISKKGLNQLRKAAIWVEKKQKTIQSLAQGMAERLYDKIPVLYAADRYESILVRWRQQINENGKQLCWHHVIPEMNHNELVGWRTEDENLGVVLFRDDDDYIRIKHRIEINRDTIQQYTKTIIDVAVQGKNAFEKSLYLIALGDWLTCYLADKRSFDAVEVKVIDALKAELSKRSS